MKLIIDIPDRIHYGIEKGITVNGSEASQILIDAVKNGTLLDDVKAEIMQLDYELESFYYGHNDTVQAERVHTICREEVLQILDNIGKESEDK